MSDDGFVDVTDLLREAAEEDLGVGEIIQAEGFTLHEAMSAIGLMNPKMDVGFGDRIRAENVDLHWNLDLEQMVAVFDELLAREASWLEAHTLPQTVYTCVYLLRIEECQSPLLFSILRMASLSVSLHREIIVTAKNDDEEDFVPWTFGLNIPLHVDLDQYDEIVLDAETLLDRFGNQPFAEDLRQRLLFRSEMYTALHQIDGGRNLQREKSIARTIDDAMIALVKARATISTIEAPGFSDRVNQHLLLTSPPRRSPVFTRVQGFDYFEKILIQLKNLCRLPTVSRVSLVPNPHFAKIKTLSAENFQLCFLDFTWREHLSPDTINS